MSPPTRSSHASHWRLFRGIPFALLVAGLLAGGSAFAQSTGNSQQDRMKACNTQAGTQNLSGGTRKSFMSDCLSGKTVQTTAAPNSQQQKMKTCNTEAASKSLAGDARSQFMSGCLKG